MIKLIERIEECTRQQACDYLMGVMFENIDKPNLKKLIRQSFNKRRKEINKDLPALFKSRKMVLTFMKDNRFISLRFKIKLEG